MQAAIDAGRCWLLFEAEYGLSEWFVGTRKEARAEVKQKNLEECVLEAPGSFAACVRTGFEVEVFRLTDPVDVGGATWRAASGDGGGAIEHPRWGWLRGWRDDLPALLARVEALRDGVGRYEGPLDDDEHYCMGDCVCTTAWDAASLDVSARRPVDWRFTEGVSPVHVEAGTRRWTWWSDGVMTATSHVPDECQGLEADAVTLINRAWQRREQGEPIRPPACGWALLTRVAEIVASEELARGTDALGNPQEAIHRFDVRMADGERQRLWARSGPACYPDVLVYDFHTEHPDDWRCDASGALLPIAR